MKITFKFDKETRCLELEPEDELEKLMIGLLEVQHQKGTPLTLTKYVEPDNTEIYYLKLKINGS